MKILFVFNHPAPYKVALFNEIAKYDDIDLTVIFERKQASDRKSQFYNEKNYHFSTIFLKKGYIGKENSLTWELKNYIKHHYKEYDLIIMNGYSTFTELLALHYMIKHKIPYAFYINGGIVKKDTWFKRKIKENVIQNAIKCFSPCTEADEYLFQYGAKPENIYHYPYSTVYVSELLKEPLSKEDKEAVRQKYNLPSGVIGSAFSQFIKRKNILEILECFRLRKEHLLLIGDGPEKKNYIKFIEKEKMKNVTILSFLSKKELFELIRACDFHITLSNEDIYGHTINEALANGLPVIASNNIISAKHLIKNGYNGYVVHDIEETVHAMNNIKNININNVLKTANENTIEASAQIHYSCFKELIQK